MRALPHKISSLLLACFGISISSASAQQFQAISAQSALDAVRGRFGPDSVTWIAEMTATGGQPQPRQWDIVAHDRNAPGILHHFRVSSGLVQDGGPDTRRYPSEVPNGFFTPSAISVDSVAAFTIAEAEARKAKLGFDSIDYILQLREYSKETVWKLNLIDANHRLVGTVAISGSNGEVLRKIWVQRDPRTGFPKITDSMSPSSRTDHGTTGINRSLPRSTAQPTPQGLDPFASVSPGGVTQQNTPDAIQPRRGSIFREFPSAGGGGSQGSTLRPSNNPLDPTLRTSPQTQEPITVPNSPIPSFKNPEPEFIPIPRDPTTTRPVPPITVPKTGGSSQRIPPPPVPQG